MLIPSSAHLLRCFSIIFIAEPILSFFHFIRTWNYFVVKWQTNVNNPFSFSSLKLLSMFARIIFYHLKLDVRPTLLPPMLFCFVVWFPSLLFSHQSSFSFFAFSFFFFIPTYNQQHPETPPSFWLPIVFEHETNNNSTMKWD